MDGTVLSLAELETFDPHAPERGGDSRRFCCPLPACSGKRVDASHRSLSVDVRTGVWKCHRCDASGKLREWWEEKTLSRQDLGRCALRRLTSLPVEAESTSDPAWREHLKGLERIEWTEAVDYLQRRAVPYEAAVAAGARYCGSWFGRPAIVFPIRDRRGMLVAACGRYLDGQENPKARTAGPKQRGVFATPGALDGGPVIVTEAPIDALSLAACGHPAIALVGTSWPGWLPLACAWRRVLVATDADDAGDIAAEKLKVALRATGARPERLPPLPAKDWNELLQWYGAEPLRAALDRWLAATGTEEGADGSYPEGLSNIRANYGSSGAQAGAPRERACG